MAKKTKSKGNAIMNISTIVGITLVLTTVGLMAMVFLLAEGIGRDFKEGLVVQVMLEDGLPDSEAQFIRKSLDTKHYTSEVKYISQEEALRLETERLGEDFMNILDEIPFPASFDIRVLPDYTRPDSVEWVASEIQAMQGVDQVIYHPVKFAKVNENMGKISLGLGILMILLLFIAVALINNTIRLAVFSKRLIIKSMQLVGATHSFIRRPFIRQMVWLGIVSAAITTGLISGLLYMMRTDFPEVPEVLMSDGSYLILVALIFVMGILISWMSTYLAVTRFIRSKQDQLY
ncbi:MAG: cell division transport system permease protein [Flavobacteriales bacterium]|jgi:cell division transport system permease protein